MRGPRPERHRPARDAVAAAGRLPGPASLSEVELGAAYDHLDDQLRPLPGPDGATDAVVHAFCCWLTRQDRAVRAAVAAVRAEREDVARAARVLARVRSGEAVVGTVHAQRLHDLAELAPLYRRARRGPALPEGLDGERAGAVFTAQADAVAAAGLDDLVAELAPALGWTEWSAQAAVLLAVRVVAVMPHALARLADGQLSLAALSATAGRLADVDDVVAGTIEEHLFGPEAAGVGLTAASLRAEVDHQLQLHDPAAATRRVRRTTSARRVSLVYLGDGQARLSLVGPVTALAPVAAAVRSVGAANLAAARRAARDGQPGPDGGDPFAEVDEVDQRSGAAHAFDASVTALRGARPVALDATSAGWAGGTGVEIRISLPSLVGVDDDPGCVEGYGWVPAWLVRRALSWPGCRLRRVLTDPVTGDLVAVDGHTYPASWLADPDPDPDPGGPGSPGDGGPPGRPSPPAPPAQGFSRGRPVQQFPPPAPVDLDLDDPADACAAGTCGPLDPAACPLASVGGGPHDPPEALRRHLTALWGTSTGPGDALPARDADLDHVTPWGALPGQGGPTCGCNLDPKSRRWHRRKHAGNPRTAAEQPWTARWQHWRCTAGHAHWRSPLGTDHVSRPAPYTDPAPRYRPWAPPPRVPPALPSRSADTGLRFTAPPPF